MNHNVEYIDFISNCPFPKCKNNRKTIRWTHQHCGGRLKLSTEGHIRCLKCKDIKPFIDWDINCGYSHLITELPAQDCCAWLNTFTNFAKDGDEVKLVAKIVMSIMKQFTQ